MKFGSYPDMFHFMVAKSFGKYRSYGVFTVLGGGMSILVLTLGILFSFFLGFVVIWLLNKKMLKFIHISEPLLFHPILGEMPQSNLE